VPPLLGIPVGLLASPDAAAHHAVYSEGGYIELVQVGMWVTVVLAAGWLFMTERVPRSHRMLTLWLGVVGVVAVAREMDLHEALNPETLGHLGVRYRIDWVLDQTVPLWLKAGWGLFFLVIGAALVIPLILAGGIRGLPHKDSARVRLFAAATGCLAMGFVFDDLLRHVITNNALKQSLEETWELLGAVFFLAAVLVSPPSEAHSDEAASG
jgi:hypothetical protein